MRLPQNGLPDALKDSKLFTQKGFKKSVKKSEHPDFNIDSIFDFNFKEGKTIQKSKPEKKKGKEKLASSFGKKVNKSHYQYHPY